MLLSGYLELTFEFSNMTVGDPDGNLVVLNESRYTYINTVGQAVPLTVCNPEKLSNHHMGTFIRIFTVATFTRTRNWIQQQENG